MTNTWIGASTLAMAEDFYETSVSADEFADASEAIFQSKCAL